MDSGSVSLHNLLKSMDGIDEIDGAIFMATTNFPELIHDALTCRPGRFDKIFNIKRPTPHNIERLLKYYKISLTDGDLNSIATQMYKEKLSMAFVTEFVKVVKTQNRSNAITFESAQTILKSLKNHKKVYDKHFDNEKMIKMGFGTETDIPIKSPIATGIGSDDESEE
jgi:SpoVK/Ycf46/Vps4 family AAA+-type ATPase